MRIAFAGGGTGGHVFPIRSLIQHIDSHPQYKEKAESMIWLGERGSLEESVAKEFSDVTFVRIVAGKIRRKPGAKEAIQNFRDLLFVKIGTIMAWRHLFTKDIDVIFCKGGYVSLPVVLAGRILKKKIILHESDTKAGLANRICARFATTIFTGFEGVFPEKEIVVGQLLSDDLIPEDIDDYKRDEKTHILVSGGSQGAESVYRPLAALIKKNAYVKSHFYVILGTKNSGLKHLFEGLQNVTCYDFVSQKEMGELLAKSDVALTRSGTTSLAEQKLFGLKLIMIPIPRTHDQFKNAQYYVKHYGDILVGQDESFTLALPAALEKVQGYKKTNEMALISQQIREAKDIVCEEIFKTKGG